MIFITGDTHIPIDIEKLNEENFPESKKLSKEDYVIICGDFGGVWDKSDIELQWLEGLNNRNFTTLFIDGNHENHHMLANDYDVIEFNGGKAHKIHSSIYHLMRGQVFTLEGKIFFTMGGASSHDKALRVVNISWWKEELPNGKEYLEANKNLEKYDYKVDYVLSHCASTTIQNKINVTYKVNKLTRFFDELENKLKFKQWFFGHYHLDEFVDNKHIAIFNEIIKLDTL